VTIRTDPEGNETGALFDLVEMEGREILEIGCGDGRLTWRYADRAAHVMAIDPFEDAIERAKERLRATDLPIDFRHVAFEDFAAASDADVQRTYLRDELEPLWVEHSGGTVYLIYPPGWAVPGP